MVVLSPNPDVKDGDPIDVGEEEGAKGRRGEGEEEIHCSFSSAPLPPAPLLLYTPVAR